jgi:hypothetical protein
MLSRVPAAHLAAAIDFVKGPLATHPAKGEHAASAAQALALDIYSAQLVERELVLLA